MKNIDGEVGGEVYWAACPNKEFMLRNIKKDSISIFLLVLFFIFIIYAVQTKSLILTVISVLILIVYEILETIWILKRQEYTTSYWIAISNILGIFCLTAIIVLVFIDKNLSDTEQIIKRLFLRDGLRIALFTSIILSSALKSENFKVNKDLLGRGSRNT